jgi:hypothetical protein
MAASANFALKAGAWFRRGRLLIVSPDSQATACPLSGRNSTYRPVQISGTSSYAGSRNAFNDAFFAIEFAYSTNQKPSVVSSIVKPISRPDSFLTDHFFIA